MAIYKRGRGFELGTTENKSSKWPERDSNPGPPDCESDALTTRPRCLGVKTCEVFLCFLAIIFHGSIVLTFQWLVYINYFFTSLLSFTGFYTKYELSLLPP